MEDDSGWWMVDGESVWNILPEVAELTRSAIYT